MSIHRRQLLARSALAAAAAPFALHARAFAGLLADSTPRGTLTAYASEAEMRQALARWQEQSRQRRSGRAARWCGDGFIDDAGGTGHRRAAGRGQERSRRRGGREARRGGRVDHQRADRRRRRGRHRQARGRLPDHPAARTLVHGARRGRCAGADRGGRRLCAGLESERCVVRRAAGVEPRRGGDRLLLRARRHRDRVVRARRRRQPRVPRHASPALVRLLQLAQLRQPA